MQTSFSSPCRTISDHVLSGLWRRGQIPHDPGSSPSSPAPAKWEHRRASRGQSSSSTFVSRPRTPPSLRFLQLGWPPLGGPGGCLAALCSMNRSAKKIPSMACLLSLGPLVFSFFLFYFLRQGQLQPLFLAESGGKATRSLLNPARLTTAQKEKVERAIKSTYDVDKGEWHKESGANQPSAPASYCHCGASRGPPCLNKSYDPPAVLVIIQSTPFQHGCMRTAVRHRLSLSTQMGGRIN